MPVAILAMEFYQINVLLVIVTDTISKLNASWIALKGFMKIISTKLVQLVTQNALPVMVLLKMSAKFASQNISLKLINLLV